MKKLFSIFFSIAFLLVFVSFFSPKIAQAVDDSCTPTANHQCKQYSNSGYSGWTLANDGTYCGSSPEQMGIRCYKSNGSSEPAPATCGSKGGICSSACNIGSYGAEITGVSCNPSTLKCCKPNGMTATCASLGGKCGSPTSSTCDPGTISVPGSTDCLGGMCCKGSSSRTTNAPVPTLGTASCTGSTGTFPFTWDPTGFNTSGWGIGVWYCDTNTTSTCDRSDFKLAGGSYGAYPNQHGTTTLISGHNYAWLLNYTTNNNATSTDVVDVGGGNFTCGGGGGGSTCTAKTGDWGTCTGVNACSTTGSRTRTNTNANCTTVNETDSSCALTPAATCNKPTAPTVSAATCNVATPTTAKLPFVWVAAGTNPGVGVFYCDTAHSCNKSSVISSYQAGDYTLATGDNGHYTEVVNGVTVQRGVADGLTAGHKYTWFARASNDSGNSDDSADGSFTAGSCDTTQPGLALIIGLDGIGHTGDQVNTDWTTKTNTATINGKSVTNQVAGSNQTPKTSPRPVILTLTKTGNTTPITITGNITYQPDGANIGKYTGTIPYGTTVAAGTYTVKVTVDGHLTKLVPGTITVTDTNTTVTIPGVNLVTGDITTFNGLSINDYNILLSCMNDSDFANTVGPGACNANASYKIRADLEDNNAIDKFDYNLFLREFKMIQAGD